MRPDLTFKERIELLRTVDLARVKPGLDFSWPFDSYQSELSHEHSHLFEWFDGAPEGPLQGFVMCRLGFDGECEIMHLACARRGCGERMLSEWIEWAREVGVKKIFLEFHQNNVAAERLYLKLNFERIGKRPHYYRDGGDAVLMSLTI